MKLSIGGGKILKFDIIFEVEYKLERPEGELEEQANNDGQSDEDLRVNYQEFMDSMMKNLDAQKFQDDCSVS